MASLIRSPFLCDNGAGPAFEDVIPDRVPQTKENRK